MIARRRRYAHGTSVPIERSRAELERLLKGAGALKFGTMSEPGRAMVYFELAGRTVQVPLELPVAAPSKLGARGRPPDASRWIDAETRRRWRVLVLTVKALLEAVEARVMTTEEAFLAFVAIPGTARTVGEFVIPRLGNFPRALLAENPTDGRAHVRSGSQT